MNLIFRKWLRNNKLSTLSKIVHKSQLPANDKYQLREGGCPHPLRRVRTRALPFLLCVFMVGLALVTVSVGVCSADTPTFTIEDGVLTAVALNGATEVTIPDGVTSIGDETFAHCSSLTGVTIPNSVTNIGDSAFLDCWGLQHVIIPGNVRNIGDRAFCWCCFLTDVTISEGVTSIGEMAFYWCCNLERVTLPTSLTCVGREAFYWCGRLTSVTIPDSLTRVADGMFTSCERLERVAISDHVTSIGNTAFSGCVALTDVTIPKGVTNIGSRAFVYCSGLSKICFQGDAPTVQPDTFASINEDGVVYVPRGTKGWGEGPGMWNGLRIEYMANVVVTLSDGRSVTVPDAWLAAMTARAATDTAANGRKVWACYLLGMDPEDPTDTFSITSFRMENGEPVFTLNHSADGSGNTFLHRVKKLGKARLSDAWEEVPPGGDPAFRFFAVRLAL